MKKGFAPVIILIVLVVVGVGGYWVYKNSQPQKSATHDYGLNSYPAISSPASGSTVTSPLRIEGTVPAGWMFEGQMPIKLLDENRKLIAEGRGQESTPGSWQSGKPVAFEGKVIFTTTVKSGFLVIEKDNPSGLPENDGSFEVPVKF